MGSKGVLLKKMKTTAVDVAQLKFSLLLFGKWEPKPKSDLWALT